ncbi:MAG TPA: hypothetical protein VGV08_09210, partial [Casimicrobiaceae bacterium]|nr:hypothetical protein [Casimicrobiaceae bacterium]
GYSDWVAQRAAAPPPKAGGGRAKDRATHSTRAPGNVGTPAARGGARTSRVRMTFKDQRELEALPDEIEALEREQHELSGRMCAPDYHRQGVEQLKSDRHRAEEIETMLRERFERWGALDAEAQAARTEVADEH